MIDIFKTLEDFAGEKESLSKKQCEISMQRNQWCRDNRSEIKKLYPKKDTLYKIKDNTTLLKRLTSKYLAEEWLDNHEEETFYFKTFDTRCYFDKMFSFHDILTVKGYLFNSDLKGVRSLSSTGEYRDEYEIDIRNLVEVDNAKKKKQSQKTKVYVMIDKNTGYYKIGRSTKPKIRERTLQSEKPTIEMLFCQDAIVKDERELHEMFEDKRIRGEWFDLNGTDLNKIKEHFKAQ